MKGNRTFGLLAAILFSACIPGLAQVNDPSKALVVQGVTFDPSTSFAKVELFNASGKTITGYSLTFTTGLPMVKDYFSTIGLFPAGTKGPDGMRPPVDGILAGESDAFPVTPGPPQSSEYRVVAVVFEDRTAIGDEAEIQHIFDRRSAAAQELSQWCEALNVDALRGTDREAARAAAKALASRMRAARSGPSGTERSAVANGERHGLMIVLDQASTKDDPAFGLQALRSHCASAPVHAKRTPGGGR